MAHAASVPAPLGQLKSNFPPFETFKLSNGMQVIFVEQHEVPKLHLELVVGGSNPAAPASKQGVADLMADLITKGTTTRSAAQIAESIESVGGSLDSNAALEWTSVSVDVLTTDTGLAFNLLNDLARNATFPQKELDVDKTQMLTSLEQDAVDPTNMANRQFGRIAYGNHPYGFITSPETVKSLTRADIVQFYQTYFKPNNALLIIVGDLTPQEARAQTTQAFGGWSSGPVPDFLKYPPARLGDTSVIYLVDRPNSLAQQRQPAPGERGAGPFQRALRRLSAGCFYPLGGRGMLQLLASDLCFGLHEYRDYRRRDV